MFISGGVNVYPAEIEAELAAFLGRRLAKYKLPKEYVFIDALPRTPYGKVIKSQLVARYAADSVRIAQTRVSEDIT